MTKFEFRSGAPRQHGGRCSESTRRPEPSASCSASATGTRIGVLNDIVFDEIGIMLLRRQHEGGSSITATLCAGTIAEVAGGLEIPNGAGLSPDGARLYVSETFTGHIFVWDVMSLGVLGERRDHFVDETLHGLDGLAVDGAGNVCVANLKESGISVINPSGELIDAFVTTIYDPYVTNVCFADDTAYVASGGRGMLYSVTWPWPGLRLHFQP